MTRAEQDDLFLFMTIDEFCTRSSSVPRRLLVSYLSAIGREYAIHHGQLLIHWEWVIANLPAFQAYLDHNIIGRPDPDIAARADEITGAIWAYANSRKPGSRVTQRLRRIRTKLETVQRKTSPNEAGERVSRALADFPHLEAKDEFYAALGAVRPDRIRRTGNAVTLIHGPPLTVADDIRIVDLMITALTSSGASSRAKLGHDLIGKFEVDHQWLGHKPRHQHGSRFRAFVEEVLQSEMRMPKNLRTNLVAASLLR